jgi:FeS assembly SUF system protein
MEQQPKAPELDAIELKELEAEVLAAVRSVYDPEIPVNIHDLGLIYELKVYPDRSVYVKMTLTTVGCPAAEFIPSQVGDTIRTVPGVKDVRVELTFDPPYHRDMMSEAARLELGFY